jgi:hypothetical protein
MILAPAALNDVAHAIQLAIAPVFLLTGIAGMLNVMTGRLARIIDRGRRLSEPAATTTADSAALLELTGLEQRRRFTSAAITATTFSALLVCLVVTVLFLDVLLAANLNLVVGLLFAASSTALVIGLVYFLREVHLATQTVRIPALYNKPTE